MPGKKQALVFLDLGDWEADGAGSRDRLVSAAGPGQAERMQRALLRPARLSPIPGGTTTCGAAPTAGGMASAGAGQGQQRHDRAGAAGIGSEKKEEIGGAHSWQPK